MDMLYLGARSMDTWSKCVLFPCLGGWLVHSGQLLLADSGRLFCATVDFLPSTSMRCSETGAEVLIHCCGFVYFFCSAARVFDFVNFVIPLPGECKFTVILASWCVTLVIIMRCASLSLVVFFTLSPMSLDIHIGPPTSDPFLWCNFSILLLSFILCHWIWIPCEWLGLASLSTLPTSGLVHLDCSSWK